MRLPGSIERMVLFWGPIVALLLSFSLTRAQDAGPRTFLLDPDVISKVRDAIHRGDETYTPALEQLRREAKRALKQKSVSVMDKEQTPPSGDKHDYMSLAPYWWPDPDKEDGLPYVRKDGERNPARNDVTDRTNLGIMTSFVYTLGLAYYFLGDGAYANHAAEMLRVWFLNPATRMNPNMKYGQAVKGLNDGRGAGLIETSDFRFVVDAIGLLEGSKEWTSADEQGMKLWFEEYFTWLTTSKNGKDEANAKNNHGTWYDVQTVSIAFFLGKGDAAKSVLSEAKTKRIASQIEPDGRMPLELGRTKALGYTTMNLNAFISLASLGDRVGTDLWSFKTDDGRCIKQAIDWVLPYWSREKPWTYQQIIPFDYAECYPILVQAGIHFGKHEYVEAAIKIDEVNVESDRARLLFGPPINITNELESR